MIAVVVCLNMVKTVAEIGSQMLIRPFVTDMSMSLCQVRTLGLQTDFVRQHVGKDPAVPKEHHRSRVPYLNTLLFLMDEL